MYGSYHYLSVMGKEDAPKDHVYDVVGSLCENCDKFAVEMCIRDRPWLRCRADEERKGLLYAQYERL